MAPLQTNATLISVAAGGATEEPGSRRPAGAGAAKFAGAARVYYREKQERRRGAEGRDVVVRRTVIVDSRDPAVDWDEGDVVALELDGGSAETGSVQDLERALLDELAGSGVETTRLELEPR